MLWMPVVRRRDVDRIDLRVCHERFGISVPAPGAMPPREMLRFCGSRRITATSPSQACDTVRVRFCIQPHHRNR